MNVFCYHPDSVKGIRYIFSVVRLIHTRGLLHRLLVILFWLKLSMDVMAQNGELRGTITDKKTGEPLYAAVFLIDSNFGATNSDGQYVLSEIQPVPTIFG